MIICPLLQASTRIRQLVLSELTWSVTTCRWPPLNLLLRRNRRAVASFPPCRRKVSKWTVLWIALTVWPRMIRSLRNSPSPSLSCASRTSAHCSRRQRPLSTVTCDPPMVEHPILVSIVRLLRPTHVHLAHLSRILVRSLFGISVPALIHSVFVDAGATLLKIVNSWPCIFLIAPMTSCWSTTRLKTPSRIFLGRFSVVTENERPLLPVHHNILAASPYVIVHTVRHVQQHASPLPLPAPNIRHQAQCDPGANISATNNILVLPGTADLKTPFPISSADRTAPAMTASILGTFVLPLSDGSTCDIPMCYCPSLADTIVSPHHFTSSAIAARKYNGYCLIDMPGCCHIQTIMIHPLLRCTRANVCTSLLDQRLTPRDLVFLGWPPSPSFCQRSGTSVSAIQVRPSSVRWPNTALACHHFLPCIQCIHARRVTMEKYNVLTRAR
jgi:hypothetical protein